MNLGEASVGTGRQEMRSGRNGGGTRSGGFKGRHSKVEKDKCSPMFNY